ncbi:MAG: ferrochelatase [Candidatus Caenarcaniphilales bacterium]|nr:ferrochelatase [Candidatus Caenarcaniphilales bacterium]
MQQKQNTAIILTNLGGPRSIDEVKEFLLDLLGDPNVIQLPFFLKPFQKLLAQVIVSRRLPTSVKLYQEIGGKSPLVEITQIQAMRLEKRLGLKIFIFMNCGKPSSTELMQELNACGTKFNHFIVLPLFPQYSTTTTKTSFEKITEFLSKTFPEAKTHFVRSYPDHPKFVQAWTERIQRKIQHVQKPFKLIFSAHGIPESYVKKGDPYFEETKQSVEAIMSNFPGQDYVLAFQSRFGKGKWLEPSTIQVVEELGQGSRAVIVPISFVSDHVETIHEIGIEITHLAEERGGKLYRVPGLNNSSLFIDCLEDLIIEKLKTINSV